jgi:abortive infection bacteriophage resistance protein
MSFHNRRVVSEKFGVPDPHMFASWLQTINVLRNIAAHHSRLWNRRLVIQPQIPEYNTIGVFDHLSAERGPTGAVTYSSEARNAAGTTIYSSLVIMAYLAARLDPNCEWTRKAVQLFDAFPQVPGHSLRMMGFPDTWRTEAIWGPA